MTASDTPRLPSTAKTDWFTSARFGLFIHWGLYSMAARHEWVMNNEKIPVPDYEQKYFSRFNPDLYNPEAWAQTAADAGMKYFVITAKHHEGFCLWDSKHTTYKSTNTPAKRDLLSPMVKAFRNQGFRTGLYYSLLDWHHPHYLLDNRFGPYRDHPDREKLNKGRDQAKYAAYLHKQVEELLKKFDPVDLLWFDFSYPDKDGPNNSNRGPTFGKGRQDWQSEKLVKLIRKLAPQAMLTDRLDLPGIWDFKTPEQTQPTAWPEIAGQKVTWEACQTFSGSWGYHRDESSWRSAEQIIHTLIDCVSKGGNLLLNVGPTSRGEFDPRATAILHDIGRWMHHHSRSIYDCTQAPDGVTAPPDTRLTYNPKTHRLYVHFLAWPYKFAHIPGLAGKVEYAQLLHDGSEVGLKMDDWHASHATQNPTSQTLVLPQSRPNVTVPVVELFLKK